MKTSKPTPKQPEGKMTPEEFQAFAQHRSLTEAVDLIEALKKALECVIDNHHEANSKYYRERPEMKEHLDYLMERMSS